MQKNLIEIKFFPSILKQGLYQKSYKNLRLVGNIHISKHYVISIIEFLDKKRVYSFKTEISK
uniref:Cytochrome b6-f complex subunit PetP n=1 Tax=Herposiphonia versicolor TaxID=2007163 RepID=A0A1Z1MFD0_9FLOR|nr:cytochrome b6-f complex subunit PetP [Herposiphonia versicolor]ARW64798.1 cytochrome b6-f complex subunit PetP [Herposiphonia versicolor]